MGDKLQIKLDGTTTEIDPLALAHATSHLTKLVKALDKEAQYTLSDLKTGSAIVAIAGPPDVIELAARGLNHLREYPSTPHGWNREATRAVIELCKTTKYRGVNYLSAGEPQHPIELGGTLADHAVQTLDTSRTSLGSATGLLYSYSHRPGRNASSTLQEINTGKPVKLAIPSELISTVIEYVETNVRVWGRLERDPVTNEKITVDVKGIEQITSKKIPPPASEYRGILGKEWLNGEDPVDLVRRERGA